MKSLTKWILIGFLTLYKINILAEVNAKSCLGTDKKIALIQSKLRHGYNLKQGEKLKAKLRQLKKKQYQCKKRRLKTSNS